MRKRSLVGKIASIMLLVPICATSLTGCGKKKSSEEAFAEAQKIDKNCIFKPEEYEGIFSEECKVEALGHMGNRLLTICQSEDGTRKYVSFNEDGSDVQSNNIEGQKEDYITECAFDGNGNAYMLYKEQKSEEEYVPFLMKVNPTGAVVSKVNLTEQFPEAEYAVRSMAWSDKYGLLCGTPEGVQAFDEQSGFKTLIDKDMLKGMGGITSIIELADNKLFVCFYDDSNYEDSNVIINVENKKIEKKLGGFNKNSYYTYFADENKNLYAQDSYGIYKYNFDEDKTEKLLDYRDSAIASDEINEYPGIVVLNEKEFIATNILSETSNSFIKLTKVNPEDVADKTVITLSAMWLDSTVEKQVMKFNRTSDKYVIKVIDYGRIYEDSYEQVLKHFNLDLTSGKAADIICFSGNEASVKKYVDKGLLMDLTPAFEKGGPLGDMEILPNIAEMMKYNDKTYTFMPSFQIETYVVKAEDAKGKTSLTFDDCDELIKSRGVDYKNAFGSISDRTNFCSYLWAYYGDEFIDVKNRKCSFNTPEFMDFLNFVNRFPEEEEEVDYDIESDIDQLYAEGTGIFYDADFRDIWQYAKLKQVVFKGDVEFVGCPNNTGKNMAMIKTTTFAVNNKTEHKDAIYDLIRGLMNSDKEKWSGFSTLKPKFEEELQQAAGEISDNNTDAQVYDPLSDEFVKLEPLSQEDIKKFYDYAVSIDTNACFDPEVSSIITEEASSFFAGQKSAEKVVDIIQNRVNVYINENS